MKTYFRPIAILFAIAFLFSLSIPADAQISGPQWQIGGTAQGPVGRVNCASGCTYSGGLFTIPAGVGGVSSLTGGQGVTVSSGTGDVTLGSSCGGDLAGTVSNATVGAVQGRTWSNAAPASANVPIFSASAWTPTAIGGDASLSAAGTLTIGNGAVTNAKLANASTTVNAQTCTLGSTCTVPWEFNFSFKNQNSNHAAGNVHQQTTITNAVTLQSAIVVVEDVGANAGNWVAKLCSDGGTCGAGNVYATCTTTCTAAVGTIVTCTINKAAVPAATTMSWVISTACNVTDPGANANAHFTNP